MAVFLFQVANFLQGQLPFDLVPVSRRQMLAEEIHYIVHQLCKFN